MDYIKVGDVVITGGNPTKPAQLFPISSLENKEFFRSDLSEKVSLSNNTIKFERSHKFRRR